LLFNIILFKVICIPDVKTIYRVPLLLEENGVFNFLSIRLNLIEKLNYDRSLMIKWKDLAEKYFNCFIKYYFIFILFQRSEKQLDEIIIDLVGKYAALEDSYASVIKALNHATLFCNKKLKILVKKNIYFIYLIKYFFLVYSCN